MAATGRQRIVESREPILTEIARMINVPLDVEALASVLLDKVPPYGDKFVKKARTEEKEWNIIALEAMRTWCDSVNQPTGSELLKVLEKINRRDIVRKFEAELRGGGAPDVTSSTSSPGFTATMESNSLDREAVRQEVLTDINNGLASKWECVQLAVRLGLPDDHVRRMQGMPFDEGYGFNMLLKWQGHMGSSATGEALFEALKDIGRKDLAHRYKRQLNC